MARFCSNCGKELNENADICLNCGVAVNNNSSVPRNTSNDKKNGIPGWAVFLIVIASLLPIVIIGIILFLSFNTIDYSIDKARKIQDRFKEEYKDDYTIVGKGTVGDALEYNGLRFTLNKVTSYNNIGDNTLEEDEEYIVFFFDIENISEEVKKISKINFKGTDGFDTEEPELMMNDVIDGVSNISFGKRLSAGDKVSGYIAFEVDKNWTNFDLEYHDFFDDIAISFSVINDNIDEV